MADRYDRSIKVRQSTIDQIKKMGKAEALKRAKTGGAEFAEGAKRFYGGNNLAAAGHAAANALKEKQQAVRGPADRPSSSHSKPKPPVRRAAPVRKPAPAPVAKSAIERRIAPSGSEKSAAQRGGGRMESESVTASKTEHPFQIAKREREAKKQEKSLSTAYKKQKEGSKYKGAFSGLGG